MTKVKKKWHYKEVLCGMYTDQGLTMRQIAQILGTTATTIKYWMKKFNIDGREHNVGDLTKGIRLTQKEKHYLSEIAKKRFQHPEDHPMFGHRHSEASRRKMSETKKRRNAERRARRV